MRILAGYPLPARPPHSTATTMMATPLLLDSGRRLCALLLLRLLRHN
jgi:hypothetical protein